MEYKYSQFGHFIQVHFVAYCISYTHEDKNESHSVTEFVLRCVMCKHHVSTSEEEVLHILQKTSHLQFPSISVRIGTEMFESLIFFCIFLTFGKLVTKLQ